MNTIFIITTRDYPKKDDPFKPVIEKYVTDEIWDSNFKKYWRISSKNYPVKKGVIGNVIFYVAPCMDNNHGDTIYKYLKDLIESVKADITETDYQLFLIAHDKDYAITKAPFVRAFSTKDNGLKHFARQVFKIDQKLCGFISYRHEASKNLEVDRVDGIKSLPNEKDQSNSFYLYDIYDCFIKHLNSTDGINTENCRNLKNILIELGLGVDFNVEEYEDNKNNSLTLNENYSTIPYETCNKSDCDKDNIDIKDIYGKNVHTDKPIVIKLPCLLDELNERNKNFFDSSIWYYAYHNDEELQWVKDQIQANSERYKLKKAREYKEFYSRMWVEDYFATQYSDHANFVIPFLFHSEQKLYSELKKQKYTDIINAVNQYKWRILLVDDQIDSDRKMDVFPDDGTKSLTKLDIVKEEFEKLFVDTIIATEKDNEDTKKNANIFIECAASIEDAKDKLKEKKYEIILLDYLLGAKTFNDKKEIIDREYSYELLKGIWYKENENNFETDRKEELEKFAFDYKKGPDNRFYFMFISAFTTAVSERLLAEGWARSEDYWYIGEGACPVNTPYLFQYRLLHIMEKRMKDMGLSKILGINSNDFEKSYIKEKIIDVIYDDRTSIRQNANNRFNEVLSVLYNYKNLLVDTHNTSNPFDSPESTLATDIVMKNAYIGGFLEHLTQLVYLTAFGTVRQWPEMWEEYQFLKSVVGKRIESIEKYIFNLKNNNVE